MSFKMKRVLLFVLLIGATLAGADLRPDAMKHVIGIVASAIWGS